MNYYCYHHISSDAGLSYQLGWCQRYFLHSVSVRWGTCLAARFVRSVKYPSVGTVLLCWHQALHETWTGYRPPDRSSGLGGRLLSQRWWGEAPLWQSGRPVEKRTDRTRQDNRFLTQEKKNKKNILFKQRERLHHYLSGHRCRTSVLSVSAEKETTTGCQCSAAGFYQRTRSFANVTSSVSITHQVFKLCWQAAIVGLLHVHNFCVGAKDVKLPWPAKSRVETKVGLCWKKKKNNTE